MDYTSPLKAIITADATALGHVGARVYPLVAPQRPTYPCMVVTMVGNNPNNTKNDVSDSDDATIQVDVYAETFAAASNAAEDIRRALDYFRGDIEYNTTTYSIDMLMYRTGRSQILAEPKIYRESMDFTICIKRDGLIGTVPVTIPEWITIEAGDYIDIPAGRVLMGIAVEAAAGERLLSAGTTIGGTDIFEEEEITASTDMFLGHHYYCAAITRIYFSSFAATMRVRIYKI